MSLADAELALGNLDVAEKSLSAVELRQEVEEHFKTGPTRTSKASRLILVGYLRHLQGRDSEALELYGEALPICHEMGVKNDDGSRLGDPMTAFVLDGQGDIVLGAKKYDSAEKLFKESLTIRENTLGRDHRDVSYSLDGIGRVLKAKGRYKEADAYFDRAAEILAKVLDSNHPDLREINAHRDGENDKVAKPVPVPEKGRRTHPRATRVAVANRFLALPVLLRVEDPDDERSPRTGPTTRKSSFNVVTPPPIPNNLPRNRSKRSDAGRSVRLA